MTALEVSKRVLDANLSSKLDIQDVRGLTTLPVEVGGFWRVSVRSKVKEQVVK
jgi:hypothetical protein